MLGLIFVFLFSSPLFSSFRASQYRLCAKRCAIFMLTATCAELLAQLSMYVEIRSMRPVSRALCSHFILFCRKLRRLKAFEYGYSQLSNTAVFFLLSFGAPGPEQSQGTQAFFCCVDEIFRFLVLLPISTACSSD